MAFWTASAKRIVIALGLALPLLGGMAHTASAQGLVEFLWGGDEEHGGKRELVGFSREYKPGQIIVSFGDRRLYHIVSDGKAMSYPIAVPREQSRWEGVTSVSSKRENPDWTPTPDMFKENPRLPSWVPGGHPMNPLGVRALYLGSSTYRIHGTDAPWTIGQAVSKGCIRMFNEDVLHLYPKVPVGTKVIVTWKNFKVGAAIASADDKVDDKADDARGSSRSPAASLYTKKVSDTREDATKEEPYGATSSGNDANSDQQQASADKSSRPRRVHGVPVNADGKPKEGFFIYPDDAETAGTSEGSKRKSSTPSKSNGASQKTAQVHE